MGVALELGKVSAVAWLGRYGGKPALRAAQVCVGRAPLHVTTGRPPMHCETDTMRTAILLTAVVRSASQVPTYGLPNGEACDG